MPLHVSEHHFVLIRCEAIENVTIILLDGDCLAEVVMLQGACSLDDGYLPGDLHHELISLA